MVSEHSYVESLEKILLGVNAVSARSAGLCFGRCVMTSPSVEAHLPECPDRSSNDSPSRQVRTPKILQRLPVLEFLNPRAEP